MRIRTILAAAAAPAALAAVLLGTAGQASAAQLNNPAGNPGNGAAVIKTQADADKLSSTTTAKNVDIPAGVNVSISWATITGNVSVEGVLHASADTFTRNVEVSGPGSALSMESFASHIGGNLSVHDSSGMNMNNSDGTSLLDNAHYWGPSTVAGDFSFLRNTGRLYVEGPQDNVMTLQVRNFTLAGNGPYNNPGAAFSYVGLQVLGSSTIS